MLKSDTELCLSTAFASLFFRIDFIDRGAQAFGKLHRVLIWPKVHKEQTRFFLEHMTVHSRDLNAVITKRLDHGIDFASEQDKVACDGCATISGRLKVDGSRPSHRRRDLCIHVVNGFGSGH